MACPAPGRPCHGRGVAIAAVQDGGLASTAERPIGATVDDGGGCGPRTCARARARRRARRRRGPGVPVRARRRPHGVRQDPPVAAAGLLHDRGDRAALAARSPASWRCPRCWPCPTATATSRRSSCSAGSSSGHAAGDTEADLGRALAALHQATPATLRAGGPPVDRQPRSAERAVRHVGRLLRHPAAGAAGPPGARRRRPARPRRSRRSSASTRDRLREVGGPPEPPARLHGDLWAGNRLVDVDGRSWLIDPAAHGGHREFDLAMMRLFGGFGADCFAAYEEVHPLARRLGGAGAAPPDRAARRPRHQVRRRLRRAAADAIALPLIRPSTGRVSRRRRRPGRGRCPCRRPPVARR